MRPRDIAQWITEDLDAGEQGVLIEDLYGYRVTPGESPIDRLIRFVEINYLDFDPEDEKFRAAVEKFLGRYPESQEWVTLIERSSQQDGLKAELLKRLGADDTVTKPRPADAASPNYIVVMKDGNQIKVHAVQKVSTVRGTPILYVGISKEPLKMRTSYFPYNRRIADKLKWKVQNVPGFYHVLTKPYSFTVQRGRNRGKILQFWGSLAAKYKKIMSMNMKNVDYVVDLSTNAKLPL